MTESGKPKRPWRRLRIARRVAYGVLLLWFGWFAASRWTATPAAPPLELTADETRVLERLDELQASLLTLPPFSSTSAKGAGWGVMQLCDAARGEWAPADRPVLRDIMKHITSAPVQRELDAFVRLLRDTAEDVLVVDRVCTDLRWTSRKENARRFPARAEDDQLWNEAIAALTARARYRVEEHDDMVGAARDLQAALRLTLLRRRATALIADQWYGWYMWADYPSQEIRCSAMERAWPAEQADELIQSLQTEVGLSLSATLAEINGLHGDVDARLDQFYTNDGSGDGWLVVSHSSHMLRRYGPVFGDVSEIRSGFWNIFSPIFNSRRTVGDEFRRIQETIARLDSETFATGSRLVDSLPSAYGCGPRSILDGPLTMFATRLDSYSFKRISETVATRRAAVVMLALSAFRHEHREYPENLGELIPRYLEEIPLELCARKPFLYERTADGGYSLRSANTLEALLNIRDDVYSAARPDPMHE